MSQSAAPSREPALLPLGQIEYEIFSRRTSCGLPVFTNPAAFSEQLQGLARMHASQIPSVKNGERQQRYQAVANAARQLEDALLALELHEIELLLSEEDRYLAEDDEASDEVDDSQLLWREINIEPAICPEQIVFRHHLPMLQMIVERLASKRKRGRPSLAAELDTAMEFVWLCHIFGWNLGVANSGSENKSGDRVVESDAVRCLAAVFHEAGENPVASIRYAKTVLRKIRNGETCRSHDDGYPYLVSFQGVSSTPTD